MALSRVDERSGSIDRHRQEIAGLVVFEAAEPDRIEPQPLHSLFAAVGRCVLVVAAQLPRPLSQGQVHA